ncbi:ArsR/SmtB family transcription factor [Streptomyces abikoensis]|uniref:ArsR/SmtB family transcription factor n=1 Tax=Streptomyces abikoensis TaxID=97398 RepID=UPI00340635BA
MTVIDAHPTAAQDHFDAVRTVVVLKAVADPTRLRLLWALQRGEQSVGRLSELVGAHYAAVSQHLARLRAAGLVTSRRDGTRMYYRTADEQVPSLLEEAALVGRRDARPQ